MADRSRFTQGTSIRSTNELAKKAVDPKPGMHGMPGFIKTGQDTSNGGLKNKTGIGPHREGPIGKKGGDSGIKLMDATKARGSMDKSYRATSTGPGGSIKANTSTGQKGGSASIASGREGPARGKPTGGAKMYGGTASVGSKGNGGGMAGKMESLRGRARTSWEK